MADWYRPSAAVCDGQECFSTHLNQTYDADPDTIGMFRQRGCSLDGVTWSGFPAGLVANQLRVRVRQSTYVTELWWYVRRDGIWTQIYYSPAFITPELGAWYTYSFASGIVDQVRVRAHLPQPGNWTLFFGIYHIELSGAGQDWPPTDCEAEALGPEQIRLTWFDCSVNETGFEIQRRIDFGSWATIVTTEPDVQLFLDATPQVRPARYYEYRVRAIFLSGPSSWCTSNPVLTPVAPPWYQPDSDNGGGASWSNGPSARDDTLGTYATCVLPLDGSWSTWLEFTFATVLLKTTEVRLLLQSAQGMAFNLQVEAHLSGAWQLVIDTFPVPSDSSGRMFASAVFAKSSLDKIRVRGSWSGDVNFWRLIEIYAKAEGQATQYIVPLTIDKAAGFLYAAGHLAPGEVVKVDLDSFEPVDFLQFGPGENYPRCVVVNPLTHAYFGLYTDPGKIVGISLDDFVHVLTKTLAGTGARNFMGADIDVTGNYAYFCCWDEPGKVVRIDLYDFSDTTLTLASGDNRPWPVLVDPDKGYLYLGLWTVPGKIVTVKLSNLVRESRLTLSAALETLSCGAIDTVNKYAYFGAMMSPGKIVKVRVAT